MREKKQNKKKQERHLDKNGNAVIVKRVTRTQSRARIQARGQNTAVRKKEETINNNTRKIKRMSVVAGK